MPAPPLASLRGVSKRFRDVVALDGLDLEVRAGELLALLGPNGAGKTTAIGMLLGLQRPDAGEARLFGRSPFDVAARRGVGVMMQEVALPDALRVRELVAMTCAYYPDPLSVEAAIRLAGVDDFAARPYAKLSGGQKRRAQFALAVCGRPQLLFLDEPTTGLDLAAREGLWAALRRLVAGGASIVLTTHYLEEAEALADRVVVLAKGRAIADGAVEAMRALVAHKRVACRTNVEAASVGAWPEVLGVEEDGGRLLLSTGQAEALVRRLLAADPHLTDLEVTRAGLGEAVSELTRDAAE